MAFFGLTALGMQDPFKVAADAVVHLPIFNDEDFHKVKRRRPQGPRIVVLRLMSPSFLWPCHTQQAFDRQKAKSKDGFSITIDQVCMRLPHSPSLLLCLTTLLSSSFMIAPSSNGRYIQRSCTTS